MTAAVPVASPQSQPLSQANAWLARHHAELRSRARACFARWQPDRREEAVAEVIALVVLWVHRAAERGTLARITPYHGIVFASRQVRSGRRACGGSSRDVLGEATRIHRGIRVQSLDQKAELDEAKGRVRLLRDTLAGPEQENPAEVARRRHDYPLVLAQPRTSAKARVMFHFLAATHGAGKQAELAAALRISPGRATQLKGELAQVLSACGYRPPLGSRPPSTADNG